MSSNWATVTALEYCDSVRDGTHDSPKPVDKGYKLVTSKHINGGRLDLSSANTISKTDYDAINQRSKVDLNDILISMIGTVGTVYRVSDEPNYAIKNIGLFKISDEYKSKFFYYYLKSPTAKEYIFQALAGSTQQYISLKRLRSFPISYPESQTQMKRIVTVLDAIESKITLNTQINDYLAEAGLTIWKKHISESNIKGKISSFAADIITGKTPSTKEPAYYGNRYPFITIPDMRSTVWLCDSERYLSEKGNAVQSKKIVPRGSVLVSCIATLGLVGLVQRFSHFNQQINAVIPKNPGEEFFLYYAMLSIRQDLLGIGATGSATLNVNKAAFSNIEIPWLSQTKMDEYVETVKPIFEAIEANSIESLRLEETRDALLPKLMSGEIDVSQVELTQLNNHLYDR